MLLIGEAQPPNLLGADAGSGSFCRWERDLDAERNNLQGAEMERSTSQRIPTIAGAGDGLSDDCWVLSGVNHRGPPSTSFNQPTNQPTMSFKNL